MILILLVLIMPFGDVADPADLEDPPSQ